MGSSAAMMKRIEELEAQLADALQRAQEQDETIRQQRNELAEIAQILGWTDIAVQGGNVSEFAESFPIVRAALDLRISIRELEQETTDLKYGSDGLSVLQARLSDAEATIQKLNAENDRFDRDLAHFSKGYTEAVTDVTGEMKPKATPTPGCDCEQDGNPDMDCHSSDCEWRLGLRFVLDNAAKETR